MSKTTVRNRSPRGLDRGDILNAAFELFVGEGESGFSVRKVGARMGIDPMTVLHHFGSKEELIRKIADRSLAEMTLPESSGDWRADLLRVAEAYRDLARRYPRLFHLHFRYNATGPADHHSSEVVYRALLETGLPTAEAAGLGLAFYAFVLGFALAETEGLLRPVNDVQAQELEALDIEAYPGTRALIPAFRTLDSDAAFHTAVGAFIDGIETRCKTLGSQHKLLT